jgi:hypothetical protein
MSAQPTYEIQGRSVRLPVEVRRAWSATALYAVPAAAVEPLLPGDAFAPLALGGGQSQLALTLVDYQDNDLGAYREIGVVFFVTPRGAGAEAAGTYIWRLPVDQPFTCEAGRAIWGFPKTVERIDYDESADRIRAALWMDGRLVLDASLPRGGTPNADATTSGFTYTWLHGAAHRTPMTTGGAAVLSPAGAPAALSLGDHPVADALRSLELPKPPVLVTWVPHMRGTFGAPEKLAL